MPNRKGRLGASFYQPLVVEICRNTCTSRDKTLQLLQNHPVSHQTHSQSPSVGFLWFLVICGSITIAGFQRSHDLDEILEIFFYIFVPRGQSNKDSKTLQVQIWLVTIELLPHTVLLNLKIVCHLAELNSIKNYSETINLFRFILATVDNYSMWHYKVYILFFYTIVKTL